MKKLIIFFLFTLICASTAFAETVSLSTYYPAPFGAYDRLRLVPRANAPVCNANLIGLIYYDANLQELRVCTDAGQFEFLSATWTQNNNNATTADIYLTEMDEAAPRTNLFVGIGTRAPQADLHVMGGGQVFVESAVETARYQHE